MTTTNAEHQDDTEPDLTVDEKLTLAALFAALTRTTVRVAANPMTGVRR